MDVFANRPAPIQISYIGYPYTTGIKNMDYRITDAICDHPQISQDSYTEKLIYFPNSFLCYNPFNQSSSRKGKPNEIPALSQIQPFVKNGYITFGCFNRLNKIKCTR